MSTEVTEHKPNHPAYRVWLDVPAEVRQDRLQTAIARVVNDEKTEDIARDMGISRSALNMAFLEYAQSEWQKAQVARALTRLERSQDNRDKMERGEIACDANALTLARDSEKSAQWQLERLCRRLFGQDAPPTSGSGITINIDMGRDATQHNVIDTQSDTQVDVTP